MYPRRSFAFCRGSLSVEEVKGMLKLHATAIEKCLKSEAAETIANEI